MQIRALINRHKKKTCKMGFVSLETVVVTGAILFMCVLVLTQYENISNTIISKSIDKAKDLVDFIEKEDIKEVTDWEPSGKRYKIGDVVNYKGSQYVCTFPHTTAGDMNWAPDVMHSLWQKK